MTCTECIHYEVCKRIHFPSMFGLTGDGCDHFKRSAAVVEVVRCKDCKWCEDMFMSGMYCNHPDNRNPLGCRPNDYCNDGERKCEGK
jgi:hypothetical protein